MSNISANKGGNLSLVQFLLNQSRRFACLAPKALNSGILCETLETAEHPPAEVASPETVWFLNACTFNASRRRSWSLCTAFTSFRPGLSLRRTAPEKSPNSVSDSWWAFKADVNCIKADTKSGCFVSYRSINGFHFVMVKNLLKRFYIIINIIKALKVSFGLLCENKK